jgi:hypothetical protein
MNAQTAPESSVDLANDKTRHIKIRLPAARFEAFAAIARAAGISPTDLLREGANARIDAIQATSTPPASNGRFELTTSARLDHLAECALQTQNQLARIENALARIDNGPAETAEQLQVIEFLVRKTLVQAVAAAYTDIQLWRLLADPSQRPAQGLPPAMLAEIQELARRIAAAAETEARG